MFVFVKSKTNGRLIYVTNNPLLHAAPDVMHYLKNFSRKLPKFTADVHNAYLDINTKKAALKASSSVVALLSYTAGIVFYSTLQFPFSLSFNDLATLEFRIIIPFFHYRGPRVESMFWCDH